VHKLAFHYSSKVHDGLSFGYILRFEHNLNVITFLEFKHQRENGKCKVYMFMYTGWIPFPKHLHPKGATHLSKIFFWELIVLIFMKCIVH